MIKAIINPIIVPESSCAETGIPEPEHSANSAALIDTRHTNGILDRLLKSEFCAYLIEQEAKEEE